MLGLGFVLGVVGGDGVAEVLNGIIVFDAGENVLGRGVVVAGGEAGVDGARGGEDFVEAFGGEVELGPDEVGLEEGFVVAFEGTLGGGLDGGDKAILRLRPNGPRND